MSLRKRRRASHPPHPVGDPYPRELVEITTSSSTHSLGLFEALCRSHGIAVPLREVHFALPRKWRFDYAWVEQKVALEVQGGLFVQGRHSRGAALLKEHEKLNAAAALGWRILYTTPSGLCTVPMLDVIRQALHPPANRETEGA